MTTVHTAHGPGQIVEEDINRGKKQYRVSGAGFSVWVDESDVTVDSRLGSIYVESEAPVNHSNSVRLPYNPAPQFRTDVLDNESTIQPTHHIDIGDRTHPADSLDFDEAENSEAGPWPGPNPDLFADASESPRGSYEHPLGPEDASNPDWGGFVVEDSNWGSNPWDGGETPKDFWYNNDNTDSVKPREASRRQAGPAVLLPAVARGVGMGLGSGMLSGGGEEDQEQGGEEGGGPLDQYSDTMGELTDLGSTWNDNPRMGSRPAGLSDKYADFLPEASDHLSKEAQFQHDPLNYLLRHAQVVESSMDPEIASWGKLCEADFHLRDAAWKDVRAKAVRLRREGKVTVKKAGIESIEATVDGDHGRYGTIIVRGNVFDMGGQSVTAWHCDCDWGKWAFKRRYTYVGRFCSHAYATYLEMQSRNNKGKSQWKKKRSRSDHTWVPGDDNQKFRDEKDWDRQQEEYEEDRAERYSAHQGSRGNEGDTHRYESDRPTWDPDYDPKVYDELRYHPSDQRQAGTRTPQGVDPKLHQKFDDNVRKKPVGDWSQRSQLEQKFQQRNQLDDPTMYQLENIHQADALRTTPKRLTPDFVFDSTELPPQEDVDVEEDERYTTGPGQIQHFAPTSALDRLFIEAREEGLSDEDTHTEDEYKQNYPWRDEAPSWIKEHEGRVAGGRDVEFRWLEHPDQPGYGHHVPHYVGDPDISPDEIRRNFDTPRDPSEREFDARLASEYDYSSGTAGDYSELGSAHNERSGEGNEALIDDLRDYARNEDYEDSYGNMDERNDRIQDGVDELRERGFDADNLVASRRSGMEAYLKGGTTAGCYPDPCLEHEPFNGSGPAPVESYGSSADYVDAYERPDYEDLTELDDMPDEMIRYTDNKEGAFVEVTKQPKGVGMKKGTLADLSDRSKHGGPSITRHKEQHHEVEAGSMQPSSTMGAQPGPMMDPTNSEFEDQMAPSNSFSGENVQTAAREGLERFAPESLPDPYAPKRFASTSDSSDIVRQFQAGADWLLHGGSGTGPGGGDDDIAGAAQAFLAKTAGRKFSPKEESDLMFEAHPQGARNLENLDLAGTHYL